MEKKIGLFGLLGVVVPLAGLEIRLIKDKVVMASSGNAIKNGASRRGGLHLHVML